jgi:uncharacterized protein DUF6980
MDQQCRCGRPERWANDPSFPVVFDVAMNEYAVVHGPDQRAQALMRYCFWCGGALPASKRGTFFMEPDPMEIAAMKELLVHVSDAISMRRVLGEPDATFDCSRDEYSEQEAKIYNIERCAKEYVYQSRWRTLCLAIGERKDGSLSIAFFGKAK